MDFYSSSSDSDYPSEANSDGEDEVEVTRLGPRNCQPLQIPPIESVTDGCVCRELYESAFKGLVRSIRFTPVNKGASAQLVDVMPMDFIAQARPLMESTLAELRDGDTEFRVHIVLTIRMRQVDFAEEEVIREEDITFSSMPFDIADDDEFERAIAQLLAKIETFSEKGSNWIVAGVEKIDFKLIAYRSSTLFKNHTSRH